MSRKCMCCNKEFEGNNCPRCGLTAFDLNYDPSSVDKGAMEAALNQIVSGHRQIFLKNYEIGVTCYYWKDDNGKIVPDKTTCKPFGNAAELVGKTAMLSQEFARIPDIQNQSVELNVRKADGTSYPIQLQIPALKEKQLQKLGIQLNDKLQIRGVLKNQTSETYSAWCPLLRD